MTKLRQRMIEELQLRNCSEATTHTYVSCVKRFAAHHHKSPDRLNVEEVREYLLHLRNERKLSWSGIQVYRAALRFFYVRVLKQRWFDEEIAPPKRHPKLPTILSADEITRILDATRNLKHWTMLAMLYATGLRSRELRYFEVEDIDRDRMVLHVRHGKGEVPRDLPLSPRLLERLDIYLRWRRPKEWLFPSPERIEHPLCDKSLRIMCTNAGRRASLKQHVHPHLFRHAFATHLLDAGVDLRTIQVLLGHADIRTTARYLRVSTRLIQSVISPFDALPVQPIDRSEDHRQR